MRRALIFLALIAAAQARAQFSSSSNQTVTGAMGAGTTIPRATLDVLASTSDAYALWIASQNGNGLLTVNAAGAAGIGTANPAALLDVKGFGDAGDIGVQLRSGNSSSTYLSSQIVFAYDSSGLYPHAIQTRAVPSQYLGNDMDFFLWNSTSQPTTIGTLQVMSLQASPATSTASVHIMPVGTPIYELVVSNGITTGGGSVMAASVAMHSSRASKTILAELGAKDEAQAYADVKSLKPASFRYKGSPANSAPVQGLIYEDSPDSVKDSRGQSIIVEARIANMEMALQTANQRIKDLEVKIAAAEKSSR